MGPLARDAALRRSSRLRWGVALAAAGLTLAGAALAAKAQPGNPRRVAALAPLPAVAHGSHRPERHRIAPPPQAPVATTAPEQTSSGGS